MARARKAVATAAALLMAWMACSGLGLATAQGAGAETQRAAGERGAAQASALPPELEEIRAAEAEELYGDPAERPMDERKTSLVSIGDSEMSGEGVGTYEPGTDGPDNWCHRSPDSAVHRTGIGAEVTYNVACSGANTENVRIGGSKQYDDELVQSESLAVKARNTRLEQIQVFVGANDDLQFGPVLTDCVVRWFTLQGPCQAKYEDGWQDRVDALVPKVERTLGDLRTVMSDAGYADDDYQLVLLGYPSPIGPDIKDNPDFPGKLPGGCTGYTSDSGWGRDGAVPPFERGLREAAKRAGTEYLDLSRLMQGHEVCMENTWVRGLHVDLSNPFPPDENSVRQSFHPNERGHGAFAACLTAMYRTESREASCADPDGSGTPRLYDLAWDDVFAPLTNAATGSCLDADGAGSAAGTQVRGWSCGEDQRNQGWWYDEESRSLYTQLTHDRCVQVDGEVAEGAGLVLGDCAADASAQRLEREDGTFRPADDTGLCVTLTGAEEQARLAACDGSESQRFS